MRKLIELKKKSKTINLNLHNEYLAYNNKNIFILKVNFAIITLKGLNYLDLVDT